MIEPFVVDASIAIAWLHPAQGNTQSEALLEQASQGTPIEAPSLWPLEVSNALLVLVRRKKLTEEERRSALKALLGLSVVIDHEASNLAFTKLAAIASEHNLTIYDAAYFELAKRKLLPLACRDGALREAARRAGVRVL